ncbi:MAG: SDR family oxidoreductase [Alicyclobacillus sp.]|nr:SDR family oxidoreductase [Alicyclobacillus sp.]
MPDRLAGKTVVVTGATKGIGKGIAWMAAEEGARVVLSGRSRADGQEVARRIRDRHGVEAVFVDGDLSRAADCERLIEEAVSRFGRIDGLVNNVGIFPRASLLETDEALFDHVFNTNLKSAFFCSKYAVAHMIRQGGGSIVHIGSTHGFAGFENLAAYACSKGGLHTLSRHIARNYARQGVRSNWITVGWVVTEGEIAVSAQAGLTPEDLERIGRETVPSGRLQTARDIACTAVYLLSDESSQVTGTDVHVTGGFNI